MIEKGLFPEDIRAYLNSHPIFNHHHGFGEGDVSGMADSDIFYHTQPGNPAPALIHDDATRLNYVCSQCDISKGDRHRTRNVFKAAWSFEPDDPSDLNMENETLFLKSIDIFYAEKYRKPSGFQFPQGTVTIQDEEDFMV